MRLPFAVTMTAIIPLDPDALLVPRWPLIGIAFVIAVRFLLPRLKTTPLEIARELVIVVPCYLLYTTVRGLIDGRESEAFARAAEVIQLERALGIFWEAELQRHIIDDGWLVSLVNSTYTWAHWPVIISTAVFLFFFRRDVYPVYRNAYLISGAIALVIYATLPVAPPRFLDAWGFVDTIADHSGAYQVLQPPAFVNQYAAMPSLHFGWNLLAGIAIVRHAPAQFKALGAIIPCGMFLSIVFTGNHFILDGVAGALVALVALSAALKLRDLAPGDGGPGPRNGRPGMATGFASRLL